MRKTWVWPWQYKEAAAVTLGLVAVGFGLQLLAPLNGRVLAAPASVALGLGRGRLAVWLTGLPVSVCLMAAMLLLALVMGLTPQTGQDRLGLTFITNTWYFRLVYGALLLVLGGVTARGLRRKKPWLFTLTHLGLYIVLLAAGLGAADRQRYTMWVGEGEVEWRGTMASGFVAELPLAIKLHDFQAEFYPQQVVMGPDGQELRLSRPQPKRFASDITFLRPGREPLRQVVEVNKPLADGGWMVYQHSYDEGAGAGSRYSGFELVYDPWLNLVWLGFALLALGAVAMAWQGRRR